MFSCVMHSQYHDSQLADVAQPPCFVSVDLSLREHEGKEEMPADPTGSCDDASLKTLPVEDGGAGSFATEAVSGEDDSDTSVSVGPSSVSLPVPTSADVASAIEHVATRLELCLAGVRVEKWPGRPTFFRQRPVSRILSLAGGRVLWESRRGASLEIVDLTAVCAVGDGFGFQLRTATQCLRCDCLSAAQRDQLVLFFSELVKEQCRKQDRVCASAAAEC